LKKEIIEGSKVKRNTVTLKRELLATTWKNRAISNQLFFPRKNSKILIKMRDKIEFMGRTVNGKILTIKVDYIHIKVIHLFQ
jgi:hypothetical protein